MSGRGGQGRGHGGHGGGRYKVCGRGSGHYTSTLNKIKVYAMHLETMSSFMVRKSQEIRCGCPVRRLYTMLSPSMGKTSATN